MSLKVVLRSCKLTASLYRILADKKTEIIHKKKSRVLQKKGKNTILELQNILRDGGKKFFFDMGTLLGIIREGQLLGHDLDIDIGCFVDLEEEKYEISKLLMKNQCQLKYRYVVDGVIVEESFLYNNIKFDINYYTNENDKSVCYLLYEDPEIEYNDGGRSVVKLVCNRINSVELYNWGDIIINVPDSPEKYLATRYGDNWRIPDKNYKYWKGPSAVRTELKGYCTVIN